MSLTPESGSGSNLTADTYATVAELRAFARKRGAEVPQAEEDCEVLLIRAMDYLQSIEGRFPGCRTYSDQPLAWPRATGGSCCSAPFSSDEIPVALKNAQMALALDAQECDLLPTRTPENPGAIRSDAIGPSKQEFAAPLTTAVFSKAEVFLRQICKVAGMLQVVRA